MYGKGLVTGLKVTLGNMFKKRVTENYPDQQPFIDERWRGSFQLDKDACIACGLCVNACPNKAINMETGKDENNKKVLTGYSLDMSRCLVCGLCVEACPKQCLLFTKEFEKSTYFRDRVTLDLYQDQNLKASSSTYGVKKVEKAPKEV